MATRNLSQWQKIVEEQLTSELNVSAFCQQNNINLKTFYNRRAKLGLGKKHKAPVVINAKQVSEVASGFVQVKPAPEIGRSAAAMTLQTSQATLQLPPTVSPQWLGQLLRELAA